jgi:hypothetical protein
MNAEHFTYQSINCRTLAAIRKKTDERVKRSLASKLIHRKGEKEAIAGWNRDLVRILHIFNVRSVDPVRRLLNVSTLDGAVNGCPFDAFRSPSSPVSMSGTH